MGLRSALTLLTSGAGGSTLDVGCGRRPWSFATVLADLGPGAPPIRAYGVGGKTSRPFVRCSVERLPFRDGAFDYVYCVHVLEHVYYPAHACDELMRVGRRGYIECPRSFVEYAFSSDDHRWLVDYEGGVLIFREKLDEERQDFLGVRYKIFEWLRRPLFLMYWNLPRVRRVRNVELHWEGGFRFCVIPRYRRGGRAGRGGGPRSQGPPREAHPAVTGLCLGYESTFFLPRGCCTTD